MLTTLGFAGFLILDGVVDNCSAAGGQYIIVDCKGCGNYTTIQQAIDNASSGSTIHVWAGRYNENILVNKTVTLIGNGTASTIINGSNSGEVVNITSDWVNVSGFNIIGGKITISRIGINLFYAQNCKISNNDCSYHTMGIHVNHSDYNTISNNVCNSNYLDGINLENSNSNLIADNSCMNNYDSIYLFSSSNNTIIKNTCLYNVRGVHIHKSSNNLIKSNLCHSNKWSGIAFYSSYNNTIEKNSCQLNIDDGILLFDSDDNTFLNNIIVNNWYGITLNYGTDNCCIFNTTINNSGSYDIQLFRNSHVIALNCSLNFSKIYYDDHESDLEVQWFLHLKVKNGAGVVIPSADVRVSDSDSNLCYSGSTDVSGGCGWILCKQYIENSSGKTSIFTPHNIFLTKRAFENTVVKQNMTTSKVIEIILPNDITPPEPPANLKFTSIGATHLNFSWTQPIADDVHGYNVYINDTSTSSAFHLLGSTQNRFYNATNLVESTTYYFEIRSYDDVPWESRALSGFNTTLDITPPLAPTGLIAKAPSAHTITLVWNLNSETDLAGYNIYINETGAYSSGPFKLIHTLIGASTEYIVTGLSEETTYYFVISAFDEVPNVSPYSNVAFETTLDGTPPGAPTGLSAKAISGTEILLTWEPNPEPDISGYTIYMKTFESGPTGAFNFVQEQIGTNNSCVIDNLFEEVTYYFKIKAFDEVPNHSLFSNQASATTPDETPPAAPTGLKVINSTYNSLTISWFANPEPDVVGYVLFRSLSEGGPFIPLWSEPLEDIQNYDNGLEEVTGYYYKVIAIDDASLKSRFSDIAFGNTLLGPYGPEINHPIADFSILEDSYNDTAINLYYWFKDINGDPLTFRCEQQNHIEVIIFQRSGTVVLKPDKDWNGFEELLFFASDGTAEISDNVKIAVMPLNDPPGPAVIHSPENGKKIDNGTFLSFSGSCTDPDLPYGDELTFTWISNLTDDLGVGETLAGLNLTVGNHLITLNVSDLAGESTTATLNLIVSENDNPFPDAIDPGDNPPKKENKPEFFNSTCMVLLALIILLIILFWFLMLRRNDFLSRRENAKSGSSVISAWPEVWRKKRKFLSSSEVEIELRCPKCNAVVKPSASRCPVCLKRFGEF